MKGFFIYGCGGHLGHVTWTININYPSPFPRRLHTKFCFDWPSGVIEKKSLDNGGNILSDMYLDPGQGQTTPCGFGEDV